MYEEFFCKYLSGVGDLHRELKHLPGYYKIIAKVQHCATQRNRMLPALLTQYHMSFRTYMHAPTGTRMSRSADRVCVIKLVSSSENRSLIARLGKVKSYPSLTHMANTVNCDKLTSIDCPK